VLCFIRHREKSKLPYKGILLAPIGRSANAAVVEMWESANGIKVFRHPWLCYFSDYLRIYKGSGHDCSTYAALLQRPGEKYQLIDYLEGDEPLAGVDKKIIEKGSLIFKEIFPGLEPDRLVVLHARDSLFDERTGNANLYTQEYRNSPITSYAEILTFLKEKGYAVVRIGEYGTDLNSGDGAYLKIPAIAKEVRDYLEFYLTSQCSMFLGSNSGALALAQVLNRPIFSLNGAPLASWRLVTSKSMSIPKLLRKAGKTLNFEEIYRNNYHLIERDDDFKRANVCVISNNPFDVMKDFKDFFSAYVESNLRIKNHLNSFKEQFNLAVDIPLECHDRNSKSQIPINFFLKHELFG
jgi:putative glycosyltransferase (TIGR04372 family)